ncbi:hypothetical protein NC652_035684 [Populus alba x Populus x berolinensis]|nr:hypothetical protein NC652_035684 [Populus alba x Populus x berolinensis]
MDAIDSVVDPLREFAKDSVRLVKRCHKPDQKGCMDHQQLEYEGSLVENLFLMRSLAFNLLNFLFDMFAILHRPVYDQKRAAIHSRASLVMVAK